VDKQQQPESEEFIHAIQYLNKIKVRYADDLNKYMQFLDILQTYQKEQKNRDVWPSSDFYLTLSGADHFVTPGLCAGAASFQGRTRPAGRVQSVPPRDAGWSVTQGGLVILPQPSGAPWRRSSV
jgi:paired amphipathic helix protein Sin3a